MTNQKELYYIETEDREHLRELERLLTANRIKHYYKS